MEPESKPDDVFGTSPLLNKDKINPSSTGSLTQQHEPQEADYRTANGKYRSYLLKKLYGPLKFVIIFGVVAVLLAIPVMVINGDEIMTKAEMGDIDAFRAQQTRLVVYYIFAWLLMSWLSLAICYAIGTVLPYVFRFIARWVLIDSSSAASLTLTTPHNPDM